MVSVFTIFVPEEEILTPKNMHSTVCLGYTVDWLGVFKPPICIQQGTFSVTKYNERLSYGFEYASGIFELVTNLYLYAYRVFRISLTICIKGKHDTTSKTHNAQRRFNYTKDMLIIKRIPDLPHKSTANII